MAILCPTCGRQYDVTLFQFGQGVVCDCGTPLNPFETAAAPTRDVNTRLSTEEADPQAKPGAPAGAGVRANAPAPAAVEMPIDGVLDLHTFQPAEVKDLVPDYLEACRHKEITRVRIIHGRGSGALLRTVHAILKRLPEVESFELAGEDEGGWGATIVRLRRRPD